MDSGQYEATGNPIAIVAINKELLSTECMQRVRPFLQEAVVQLLFQWSTCRRNAMAHKLLHAVHIRY